MNTDTPETDTSIHQIYHPYLPSYDEMVTVSISRRLERERNQARKERDELKEVCNRIAAHAVNDPQQALAELLASDGILRIALEKLKEPKSEGVL